MSLKSRIFALSLVVSLGIVGPNSSAFASDAGEEGGQCCGCWTGFVAGLRTFGNWITRAAVVIDDVLDEVDDRLEQFQGIITRLDNRLGAFVTIAGLEENENVLRIQEGIRVVNVHIDLVQSLINAADDIVEDARDGVTIQDVWTAVRAIRTSLGALHEANVINAGHVVGANGRLDDVEDRLDGIGAFWDMGAAIVNNYRGFSSQGGTFTGEDDDVVIDMGGLGGHGDDEIDDL
ncbi:MAG: hypothetical protein GY915_04985 [bacterium]|nr:hypothetical protein [bacterium]